MTPKPSLAKKPDKRQDALTELSELRARACACLEERNAIALQVIENVHRGAHLCCNLTVHDYVFRVFGGLSDSYASRLALQATQLGHIPRQQLEEICEGRRFHLARAMRELGPKKTIELVEQAQTEISVDDFKAIVDSKVYAEDRHNERWEPIGRLLHGEKLQWRACIERLGEAWNIGHKDELTQAWTLTGADEAAIYLQLRLMLDELSFEDLRARTGTQVEEVEP